MTPQAPASRKPPLRLPAGSRPKVRGRSSRRAPVRPARVAARGQAARRAQARRARLRRPHSRCGDRRICRASSRRAPHSALSPQGVPMRETATSHPRQRKNSAGLTITFLFPRRKLCLIAQQRTRRGCPMAMRKARSRRHDRLGGSRAFRQPFMPLQRGPTGPVQTDDWPGDGRVTEDLG